MNHVHRKLHFIKRSKVCWQVWSRVSFTAMDRGCSTEYQWTRPDDVEGWHHRINNKAQRPNLQFYVLIQLLHK